MSASETNGRGAAAREGRDWNSEFQKLVSELRRNNALHNPDDRSAMQVYHDLTELGNDFLYAAKVTYSCAVCGL